MLKTVLLKEWHGLSDKEMEEALSLRVDFLLFAGFDINEATLDESTICLFRNALGRRGLDKVIFAAINSQLEAAGVQVNKSNGAIIDATIVSSASRPQFLLRLVHGVFLACLKIVRRLMLLRLRHQRERLQWLSCKSLRIRMLVG
ncbi:MAG: transposase [Deltaproteobacteria bacterium]|nr:transposase [Deltaproteobacteria bacterium]